MINYIKYCLSVSAMFTCFWVSGQTQYPINTDRPDQSDGVYILPENKFQIENGITLANETFLNNFMLRYGISKSAEIRLQADAGLHEANRGLLPLTLSAKQRITNQHKLIPAITIVGYIGFNKLASEKFAKKGLSTELKLAFENQLSDKFSVGYNIGTSSWFKNLNLSCGLGYSPVNETSFFVEYFATFPKNDTNEHHFDLGILYLVSEQLQMDIAFGRSLFASDSNLFFTTGISYRFN